MGDGGAEAAHLPPLASGEALGCYALTEPGCGSDAAALATRAERNGDGWALTGSKVFITLGAWASTAIVFARTGGEGPKGISAFLVPTGADGFEARPMKGKLGLRAQDTAEISLDGVRVPAEAMLGPEGDGFKVAMSALDNGRISLAAGCVGIAQGCLDASVGYAKERTAFRKPIASFQLVQQLLAEMHVETEAARLLTWRAASLADAGEPVHDRSRGREVVRERGCGARGECGRPGPRRLRVRGRIPCGEIPSRRARHDPVRGHEPDPDPDRRPCPDRAERFHLRRPRMPEAVIVSAVRTPIGRAGKGSLMDVRPDDLLAFAIREAVGQAEGLDPNDIVDVMVGCGFPQEKQGMNLARRAALLAGLPKRVPGTTVNRSCASSLQTTRMAFHAIKAGEGDVYVAAGVESISQVDGYPKDSEELHPKLVGEGAIANVYIPMGLTAENVAERYDVSREDMDRFAQRSQERAVAAQSRVSSSAS